MRWRGASVDWVHNARDLGNGRYVIPLIAPTGADPAVTLTIEGSTLFAGPLSDLEVAGTEWDWRLLYFLIVTGALILLALIFLARRRA